MTRAMTAAIRPLCGCVAASLALAIGAVGCDGGDDLLVCGPGTVLEGDVCVPSADRCGDGTVFDAVRGECVLAGDVCAPGDVLVGDHCEEAGDVVADLEESAEPNDAGGLAGAVPLPAEGDDITLHGCINPYGEGTPLDQDGAQLMPDIDSWTIQVDRPTLLDITSDGVGGLAAAFLVLPADAALQRDGWSRWAFNLVGHLSRRQVFLPAAGDYEISMWDSRALVARLYTVVPLGAGGPGACYYATVRRAPIPDAIDLPIDETVEAPLGRSPRLYRFDPTDGELLDVIAQTPADTVNSSVATTMLIDDVYVASSTDLLGAARIVTGFSSGERALLVVDALYDYSPESAPSRFRMNAQRFASQPLLLGRQKMTLTNPGGDFPTGPGDYHILRFDVPAGQVVFTDLDFSTPTNADILDGRALYVADGTAGFPLPSVRSSIRYAEPGRHFLLLFTPGAEPGSRLDVTAQMTPFSPPALALDAPIAESPLGPRGEAWYTLDLTDQLWLQFDGAGRDIGGDDLQVELFDPTGYGTVYSGLYPSFSFPLSPGVSRGQFFPHAETRVPWLVRLSDPFPPPLESASFDFKISRRPFTDLGTLGVGAVIRSPGQPLEAGGTARYFLRGAPGQRVTVSVAPTDFDASVRSLGGDEFGFAIDEGGPGQPERFVTDLQGDGVWIAFDVQGDAAGSFDVEVTSTPLPTYRVSATAVRFADVCGAGRVVPLHPGFFGGDPTDEGLSDLIPLPFPIALFGDPVSEVQVGSNGWVSGEGFPLDTTSPDNRELPQFDGVNGAIIPYWDDLEGVRVCALEQAGVFVLQWDGWLAGSPTRLVQFQVRLHADGAIDFVYGPLHMGDGASATVGAENLGVDSAAQVVFNQRGRIRPDTSITLRPR